MTMLRRIGRRSGNRSRGQALLEFAFVLPMFVFLLLILFDFGRVVYAQHTMTQDAREGLRVGLAAPDVRVDHVPPINADGTTCAGDPYQCLYADIRAAARRYDQGNALTDGNITGEPGSCSSHGTGLPDDGVSPAFCFYPSPPDTIFGTTGGISRRSRVVVVISKDVPIITPIISQLVGETFHVTATAISYVP